jgi:hypothetical protein
MKAAEIARVYNVSLRTAKRYRAAGAPADDNDAMLAWIDKHRGRMGVGKYTPRKESATTEPVATIAPIQTITAEILPAEPTQESLDDKGSTLQRLEEAERVAYSRYVATGGSERAALAWLGICDQKRKLVADQRKQASDISESETKFIADCTQVIDTLNFHLQKAPKLLGMICEGLERDVIEAKIADQLQRTIVHAAMGIAGMLRGTSLDRSSTPLKCKFLVNRYL